MLDMYSKLPLTEINYRKGSDFLTPPAPRSIAIIYFVRLSRHTFFKACFSAYCSYRGPAGVRAFVFRPRIQPPLISRLRVKLVRRVKHLAKRFGLLKEITGDNPAPQSFKIPLVKWQRGYAYITSHRLNPVRLAPVTGAVLHFKYFQDFGARVKDAVDHNIHYDGSIEYKRYAELLARNPELSMMYGASASYDGSAGLLALGLIKSDPDWQTYE